jgi:hypothetical protein
MEWQLWAVDLHGWQTGPSRFRTADVKEAAVRAPRVGQWPVMSTLRTEGLGHPLAPLAEHQALATYTLTL